MSRLTLRLPNTLHEHIKALAESENVSINQYVVYALTRQVAQNYSIQEVPLPVVRQERAAYNALLQSLGDAPMADIQQTLAEREEVAPEADLDPQVVARLQQHLSGKE